MYQMFISSEEYIFTGRVYIMFFWKENMGCVNRMEGRGWDIYRNLAKLRGEDVNYWILEMIGKTLQEMDFPFSPYNYIRKCKSSTNILSTQLTVFMRYASRTAWFSLLIWNPLPQIFPYIIKTALHLDHHQ